MTAVISSHALLPVSDTETVIPDPGRLIFALRQIGYSLEQALSDLVDNSLSAGAGNVLIRFLWEDERIVSIAVVDDGLGMAEVELRNAMRFGSKERVDTASLGKFGLGLKLASFSHSRQLTVVSTCHGMTHGRRWTLEGIRRHWECAVLDTQSTATILSRSWGGLAPRQHGTIVLWEDIDKLPVSPRGLRYTLRALHRRLALHLGLHFHRFLQSGRLRILIDQQEIGLPEHQLCVEIDPLDPFAYGTPPAQGFPAAFPLDIRGAGNLVVHAHVWPPNSDLPEYKLGNRAAARQGFYFYRNDRLIQAGGWNGLLQHESEPHSSLARIVVDLPPALDDSFSLNVQKSSVIVPQGFHEALSDARTAEGMDFDGYRQAAQTVYRSGDRRALASRHLVPGQGFPAAISEHVRDSLQERRDTEAQPETLTVDVDWQPLGDDEFFRVDPGNGRIMLNQTYRDSVLAGLPASRCDVPLIKSLLYLLVGSDVQSATISEKRRRDLARMNRLLAEAAGLGRG